MKKILALLLAILMLTMTGCTVQKEVEDPSVYFFPSEEEKHEGTWLAWPHKYSGKQPYYFGEDGIDGEVYVEMLEPIWIEMTKALHTGEIVHIIVYNEEE